MMGQVGGTPVRVPLERGRFDLEAILAAVTPRTKLVFIAAPNNPTGTTNTRAELDAYFAAVPPHVLTVLDQAYFEYVDDPDYPDGIAEYAKAGRRVLVLRTFSKIFGLAGLRVGYGVGSEEVVTAIPWTIAPRENSETSAIFVARPRTVSGRRPSATSGTIGTRKRGPQFIPQ